MLAAVSKDTYRELGVALKGLSRKSE
jgi:hypothetical protein